MNKLNNMVAVITGGAAGIGKTTSLLFAKEGAQVIIWDLNQEKAEETIQMISETGGRAHFMKVDTSDFSLVEKAVDYLINEFGKIDILVNNAGITRDASLKKMTIEQWQQVIDVNLTGVFNCTKHIADQMLKQESGRIINTSSVVGLYGNFGQTNYVAAKSGVIGMTKVWARELGRKGINVNAVAPGFIATEMTQKVPEEVLKGIESKIPLGKMGKPEDIAKAYLFLSSDDSNYVNGTVLSVDGGMVV
ncbi:3-oxoacyl-[acyl-carrier-protein] reductase [Flammeovirga yaeyamensis]|uniref:3-oxoacyl-[acyl-carrier-protein] reductase n=2 Tax=Flammeovirga yaeyamensis TaxID=367791 RepID=A0AAX1NBL6_9BACT|nr:3-oxoacyl-[acyl-carrier-protein] reductase [Flammeovirga yaeyamensis]NMF33834.1 3-oxoacyl-[acyl-carrier-protein] reductase [Flammeovirga yaeyamensis]QWG04902.1 3-oxoacyl-[acyl-carrier-protein] reductase [Flammeovirga yaeyamensis]